jgi:hypothetical protein
VVQHSLFPRHSPERTGEVRGRFSDSAGATVRKVLSELVHFGLLEFASNRGDQTLCDISPFGDPKELYQASTSCWPPSMS